MEAKTWQETVMADNFDLRIKYQNLVVDNSGGHGEWNISKLLTRQAEISFEAGRKSRDPEIAKAKKAGMKEVVEWIKKHRVENVTTYFITEPELQVFLKEKRL